MPLRHFLVRKCAFCAKGSELPAVVPQLSPVKDFKLGLLYKVPITGKVGKQKNVSHLNQRIQKCLKKFDWIIVQLISSHVKTNLRKAKNTSLPALLWFYITDNPSYSTTFQKCFVSDLVLIIFQKFKITFCLTCLSPGFTFNSVSVVYRILHALPLRPGLA